MVLNATDAAGNVASLAFDINITDPNFAPVLTANSPSMGATDEDTAKTIPLTGFINSGSGTTSITDANSIDVTGGIALVGLTGNGTWSYSTDGTTFTAVGTVSVSSALLLPANATLKYMPDTFNGETATITYRAWDASTGTVATKVDTTTNGGNSSFSTATDTAALTVTDVNDVAGLRPRRPPQAPSLRPKLPQRSVWTTRTSTRAREPPPLPTWIITLWWAGSR